MGMGKAALSTCGALGVEAWVVVAVGVLVDTWARWGSMCMLLYALLGLGSCGVMQCLALFLTEGMVWRRECGSLQRVVAPDHQAECCRM